MNSENSSSRCESKWEGRWRERGGEERLVDRKVGPESEVKFCSHANSQALHQHNGFFNIDGLKSMYFIN